uniref:Recep_L_domain domain-containing protein n=1 Tax=Meloidogyne hapla TaxID=6305 RepID=A0A1I8BUZ3_MELHA
MDELLRNNINALIGSDDIKQFIDKDKFVYKKVEDLYLEIKGIFINNDESLTNSPVKSIEHINLHYIGGAQFDNVEMMRDNVASFNL